MGRDRRIGSGWVEMEGLGVDGRDGRIGSGWGGIEGLGVDGKR